MLAFYCGVLGGCGTDNHAGAQAPAKIATLQPGPTNGSFVGQVNAICTEFGAQFRHIPEPANIPDVDRWAGQAQAVLAAGLRRQRAVQPPPGAAKDYAKFVTLAEGEVRILGQIERAGKQLRVRSFDRLFPKSDALDERADAIARRLGFGNACIGS